MNLHEMEELARAPQHRINLHVIQKLESIEEKAVDNCVSMEGLEKRLTRLERWKAWACGLGTAIVFLAGLVGWEIGKK